MAGLGQRTLCPACSRNCSALNPWQVKRLREQLEKVAAQHEQAACAFKDEKRLLLATESFGKAAGIRQALSMFKSASYERKTVSKDEYPAEG